MAFSPEENPPELYLRVSPRHGRIQQITPGHAAGISAVSFGSQSWAVAFTTSRSEKTVANALFSLNVPYFFPQRKSTAPVNNRAYLPLFPGYLFYEEPPENPAIWKEIKGVFNIFRTAMQRRLKAELAFFALENRDNRSLRDEASSANGNGRGRLSQPRQQHVEIIEPGITQERSEPLYGVLTPPSPEDNTDPTTLRVTVTLSLWGKPVSMKVPVEHIRPVYLPHGIP